MADAPRSGFAAGRWMRRLTSVCPMASSASGADSRPERCTRSLKGSRWARPAVRRAARRWITETSKARRRSAIWRAKGAASSRRTAVRAARPRMQASSAGEARAAASASGVGAGGGEGIERDIDPVEVAIILPAILQMIDHLQRRAEGVRGGPGRPRLAMDVEDEAADRHGREGAIIHEVVPIGIAMLGHVEAEGAQQIERMARRQAAEHQRVAQRHAGGLAVLAPQQRALQPVDQGQLLSGRQARMIGHVIGGAHEAVEGEDDRPVMRGDQPGGDGKILVAMALARAHGFRGGAHADPAKLFPLPRFEAGEGDPSRSDGG